ncbi:MAG: hypothetical protein ACI8XO_000038 [Verrucomicrobiales bacterium]|jgi:hypothetical protein
MKLATDTIWFAPPALPPAGCAIVRLLFAITVYFTVPGGMGLVEQPEPVGIARLFDLTFLSQPGVMPTIKLLLIPVLIFYALGFGAPVTLTLMLLATVLPGTLDNSQGATQHSLQAVSLITLAQLIYHLAACTKWIDHDRSTRSRWGVFMGQQAIVAAYTVTALTKLGRSGLGWIAESKNFPIQMTKNIQMQYYNTLEPETVAGFWAKSSAWLQQVLVDSPNLCRLLMSGGLFLELFAILALCGRRFAAAYGALLIVFHILVRSMTGLNFRYHIAALFIFLILPTLISFIQNLSAPRSAAKVNEL